MASLDRIILKLNDLNASVSSPGQESGAREIAPTLHFNDPNKHLIEIRTYEHG
jgi:hypothetical protein